MTASVSGICLAILFGGIFGFWWWRHFCATRRTGKPKSGALPGATPCPRAFIAWAAFGAVILVVLESAGELLLGIQHEQKDIPIFFLAAMLSAAVVEEVIFRGYVVVLGRGRFLFALGVVGASLLFALAHDFLWQYESVEGESWWRFWGGFSLNLTCKAWYSFGFAFLGSIYFYCLRFHPRNAAWSLLPCFVAHAVKNIVVFGTKLLQGHVI